MYDIWYPLEDESGNPVLNSKSEPLLTLASWVYTLEEVEPKIQDTIARREMYIANSPKFRPYERSKFIVIEVKKNGCINIPV